MTGIRRHRWSEPARFVHKSERTCLRPACGIVKVTRHEGERHWVEFWRGMDRVPGDRTAACEGEPSPKSGHGSPGRAPARPADTLPHVQNQDTAV